MKTPVQTSGRGLVAAAAVAALTAGQALAAHDDPYASIESARDALAETFEAGTIPAARPGLPRLPEEAAGARGPIRSDEEARTDPSIRDTHPLTVDGLWEQLPNNQISTLLNR